MKTATATGPTSERQPRRTMRPLYVDRLAPCNHACPAGENIQAWLAEAQAGNYRAAWDVLVRDNPMPAVHGRVCYHPCEDACNRSGIDQAVSVHSVERFLGDLAIAAGWAFVPANAPSGKRVLVVGAGPSGLSAAYHLARVGHEVTIYDAGPLAGGMMHFGIPKYRLPREVLDAEVRRIEALGVNIVLNRRVDDLQADMTEGRFDAAFVAVGAHLSKRQSIPARDAGRIYDALQFLKDVEVSTEPPKIGRRVAIYGGGNTAMDAARTARRLGATETVIIYRRTRAQMPAHSFEADDALAEGVAIHWLRTIKSIEGTTITVEVMQLDEKGFPQPTGEVETLDADSLILALGQDTDTRFLENVAGIVRNKDGTVVVGRDMMTSQPGIFAGGDMVPGDRTITTAVGHGKLAARHIDAWLRGVTHTVPPTPELATREMLHRWYEAEAGQSVQPTIDLDHRTSGFDEVIGSLSAVDVHYEAQRCLSCGNCFECDGCYSACPEDAVIKLGPGNRYEFALDRCTGCAICFDQCPCAAIAMIPEPSLQPATGGQTT